MHTNLKLGISFVVGLIVGGVATKKYMDYKFEQEYSVVEESTEEPIITEEVDFEELPESEFKPENVGKPRINSVDDEDYITLLNELGYIKEEEDAKHEIEYIIEGTTDIERPNLEIVPPYNISQDEFEDIEAFESDEFTYYQDGYVTDSYGIPMDPEEVLKCLGPDFKNYFGTYMDDQIWVRNTELEMDYSVILDLENFEDIAPPRIKKLMENKNNG